MMVLIDLVENALLKRFLIVVNAFQNTDPTDYDC